MKTVTIGGKLKTGAIALGCMRTNAMSVPDLQKLINTAIEGGIDFFDHADIYGGGESERLFGQAVKEAKVPRDKIFMQTKCGIRKGFFDFSKEHIIASAEASLKRLDMDYVDVFLLHRPDTLMEPEEVAEAFDKLHKEGKVRQFGVSNHKSSNLSIVL